MKNLFVPYELAEKLKEKGFEESCIAGYNNLGQLIMRRVDFQSDNKGFCLAPLYQQVIDWFREKHNIHINPKGTIYPKENEYRVEIEYNKGLSSYKTKTRAIEKAINLL